MNTVNFADEAVQSDSFFRLISKSGDDTSPGERGLLLYKGDNVCDEYFSNYSANAMCREMGYKQAAHWTTTGDDRDFLDSRSSITPTNVVCDNEDWKSCSYSTDTLDCDPWEHVLITCTGTSYNTATTL